MRRILLGIGAVIFAAIFAVSGSKVLSWYLDSQRSQAEFTEVANLINQTTPSTELSGEAEEPTVTKLTILEEYSAVYEQNNDFVGWVLIEDTKINYPVMQSSAEEPDFYLKHNFEKQYSEYGVPYLQIDCDLLESDNLIIYGHHMNNDSMFSDLCKYTDVNFYNAHKIIHFDTKYSHGTYEIVAVFSTTANDGGFKYHQFVDAENEAAFNGYIAKCKEISLYNIETTAQYGDKLITLSTCEYTHNNGRMVVVAKQIPEQSEATTTGTEAQNSGA